MRLSSDRDFNVVSVGIEPPNPRDSFFNVISLFGPVISAAIVNRHMQRDALLTAEAHSAITTHGGIGANGRRTKLNTLLALQTILCTEYRYVWPRAAAAARLRFTPRQRNSYFAAINLVGVQVFDYVGDNPQQHDGIIEAEAARVDDLIEIIRCAAD